MTAVCPLFSGLLWAASHCSVGSTFVIDVIKCPLYTELVYTCVFNMPLKDRSLTLMVEMARSSLCGFRVHLPTLLSLTNLHMLSVSLNLYN